MIRRGTSEDFPALAELWKEFMDFHEHEEGFFRRAPDGHEHWIQFLESRLSQDDFLLLVACEEDGLVGYCLATVMEFPPVVVHRKYGFIQDMAVTASCRRQGYARQLFNAARDWLAERGMNRLELKVDAHNETSQAFWRAMGFRPHSETWWRPMHDKEGTR